MLRKIAAFLKKDFLFESSYTLAFLFNIFGVFASVITYFFIDRLFGHRIAMHLEEFGVGFFPYVLLSMAFFSYIGTGIGSFSTRIQAEQMQGTLEAILLTPTKVSTILLSLAAWNLILATFDMMIYLLLGIFLFRIDFSGVNLASAFTILILSITSFSALGILSASFILVFKRGNPVSWIITSLEGVLGGVYFPVTVLPRWLQALAQFFPITHAIRAIELAVYRGYTISQLAREIFFLALFTIVLLPVSLAVFTKSLAAARRDGSLGQY